IQQNRIAGDSAKTDHTVCGLFTHPEKGFASNAAAALPMTPIPINKSIEAFNIRPAGFPFERQDEVIRAVAAESPLTAKAYTAVYIVYAEVK
ncbi:hypothetical protein, partial [Pseudomonas syringae group genomosp. 7]|uniref:hypothetical protein n=1 Tax=Pseudomonas syringae group genomosp. 7 TaxID=251699 RepID=UPI003770540D